MKKYFRRYIYSFIAVVLFMNNSYNAVNKSLAITSEEDYYYELIPLMEPFNKYFYLKTNDMSFPQNIRFADRETKYTNALQGTISFYEDRFGDVKYDDDIYPRSFNRVNGGYIFKGEYTDGGELILESKDIRGIWMDTNVRITIPKLCDEVDYLIQTYGDNEDLFDNLDVICDELKKRSVYSYSYSCDEITSLYNHEGITHFGWIDSPFMISAGAATVNKRDLLTAKLYPFTHDSLGISGTISAVAERMNKDVRIEDVYDNGLYSHSEKAIIYNGRRKVYGGSGTGQGHMIPVDKLKYVFTFENNEKQTVKFISGLVHEYVSPEYEITNDKEVTWQDVYNSCSPRGSWTKIYHGESTKPNYTYFYQSDSRGVISTSKYDAGIVGYYPTESLGICSNIWINGRYVDEWGEFIPGTELKNHPDSPFIKFNVAFPRIISDTDERFEFEEMIVDNATYYYNSKKDVWELESLGINDLFYHDFTRRPEQLETTELIHFLDLIDSGKLDQKYYETFVVTRDYIEASIKKEFVSLSKIIYQL